MSKAGKRVKSGNAQQGGAKWEQALLTTPFDEEKWKGNLTFVVGNRLEDYTYINILAAAAAAGTRKLFSVIGKESLFQEVCELGNPKAKKGKDAPAYFEVCEPCKVYLDNGEDIPLPLLARLIKFKLLAIKTLDIKRREAERKAAADKDKGGKKDKKDRAKSPKKGGKKTPEPQSAKEGSKLKKRGEEDTDSKYIDDEPDDGAQHYILFHGFNNPYLFGQLAEVGVNVDAVIRVSAQDYTPLEEAQSAKEVKSDKEKDEKTLALEEIARTQKQKAKNELKKFWKDMLLVLQRNPDTSKLHDIPKLEYEVKSLMVPNNMEDVEQKTNFGAAMFEDIAVMIYDLIDARRLYQSYLENLKLLHIPVHGQPAAPPAGQESTSGTATPGGQTAPQTSLTSVAVADQTDAIVDMRYYNDLMNCIPQESVSVSLIMHCILEQVEATEQNRDPPSEQIPAPRTDGLNNALAKHLSQVAFKLALTEDEHKDLSSVFDLPERPPDQARQPLLMNSKDDITIRTHHLEPVYGLNPMQIEKEMLKQSLFAQLRQLPRPSSGVVRERAARLQELIHFCATGTMSPSEIDRAFKQFVFESMDLASTDSNGFIITRDSEGVEHSAIPWDDPYPYYKGMIPHHQKAQPPKLTNMPLLSDDERSGSELEWMDSSLPCSPIPTNFSPTPTLSQPATNSNPQPRPEITKITRRATNKQNKSARSPTPDDKSVVNFSGDSIDTVRKDGDRTPTHTRPSSSDSKKGILRPSSRNTSPERHSRSNSVHFEIDDEGRPIPPHLSTQEDEEEVVEEDQSIEDHIKEIVEAQKRTLDQWCFAEQFEASILQQVMMSASYNLPFIDTYYHKRDHSLLVVLHNPHNQELQNHVDWHTELHSNMGFRNYLEYTVESIGDWLKEKDAEYKAHILSKEVAKIREDEEAAAKAAEKPAKGSRSKSPTKRSASKSPKGSRASSLERPGSASSNPFIRNGSLKAWKEEQDRIKAEEEEKERARSAKRSRSPKKKREEEKDKDDKEKKRPGSRSSAKSKASQKDTQEPQEAPLPSEPQEEEKYWPFTGYDVGNNMVHVSGILTSMFPSDGGQIRTERTEFVQGTTSVRTSVVKDNHVLCVHILDPRECFEEEEAQEVDTGEEKKDLPEKAEFEKTEKENETEKNTTQESVKKSVSAFGSITAVLSDGMTLALSQFGADGQAEDGKKYEPEVYVPPPISISPSPQVSQGSPTKGKKDKGKAAPTPEPPQPPADEEVQEEPVVEEDPPVNQPFQQLYVTCPDGLHVRYYLQSSVGVRPDSEDDRELVVKQSYPFKTRGCQPCEAARKKYALSEHSRVITSDGTVIKTLTDGSVEVLQADGTVHKHTGSFNLPGSRSSSPQRGGSARSGGGELDTPTKKTAKNAGKPSGKSLSPDKLGEHMLVEESTPKKGTWVTTYPSGEKMAVNSDGTMQDLKPVMICVASDPETGQSMSTRDDHVVSVTYPDGTVIVEHSDGTRITTYYRDSNVPVSGDDQSETGEPPQLQNQTIKFVKVECPAYATVQFNCKTSESLTMFGSGTNINVFSDGFYAINHCEGGKFQVDTEGTVSYFPRPNKSMEQILPERGIQYVLRHNADIVCETVDSDGNVFNVNHNGDFSVITANGDETSNESIEESKPEKGVTQYTQHAPRFFIIHADGSGIELMRYQDVAEYLMAADESPATAILRDPLPDHPGVTGITVLKPYIGGPSDRWIKKYDMESIIPNGIRSRDLTTLPPTETKKPGPKFGTTVGQGLAVGTAVRNPVKIPILKCPSALELRQIVQYKPVTEALRNQLRRGLQEYAEYVMARQQAVEEMQIQDPRSEEEKILAADLLATVQQDPRTIDPGNIKDLYEMATTPPAPSPPPTPQPKRTQADWERDQREVAEEIEGRNALRNNTIPNYFESELGKAFLLTQAKDMDHMMQELSEDPRRDGTEAVRADTSNMETPLESRHAHSTVRTSQQSDCDRSSVSASPYTYAHTKIVMDTPSSYPGMVTENLVTPSSVRPGNPTPAHATGQGSPAPLRPKNPTPAHAEKSQQDRPVNPTPKLAGGVTDSPSEPSQYQGSEYPAIQEQPTEEEGLPISFSGDSNLTLTRSLKVNVIGEPRKDTVPLPSSIKGGRPTVLQNNRYKEIEEPVRRRVNNSVVAGATQKGQSQLEQMRGLNLLPEEVDFGVLKEGYTYSYTVYLKNTGVDSCRFKVQQPPPATGLRIVFKPGPIAAGMRAELVLELYAIAVGVEGETGVGNITHNLIIVSETDVLHLPIRATVLTTHEYDSRIHGNSERGKSPKAKLVSTKPPSSTGIIRPRRDQEIVGKV